MFEDIYIVYIRVDDANRVTEVNSSAFISDCSGWIEIDRGDGDKYHHAQGNYLPKPIMDENGVYRFKFENGAVCERSADEMAADLPVPELSITTEQRLSAMENAMEEIINMLMEV